MTAHQRVGGGPLSTVRAFLAFEAAGGIMLVIAALAAIAWGIGFTMSLFIGTLSFDAAAKGAPVRLGVLCAPFCPRSQAARASRSR